MSKIAFRTDSSLDIGTGHVMRCLTVARELRRRGAACVFICRELPGNLFAHIRSQGFPVRALRYSGAATNIDDRAPHASWLGASYQEDANQSVAEIAAACDNGKADWLIVDHYALDSRWEDCVRTSCRALFVIDDLADRQHHCDALLDQNIGRRSTDYQSLVNSDCDLMTGAELALLRPEFAELREASIERRQQAKVEKMLVSMGGIDRDNATGAVLEGLKHCKLPREISITVVMGRQAPWLEAVKSQAANLPWPTQVVVDVPDMALLMASADLAIGAAGTTTWERCCLGLPSLVLGTADNQRYVLSQIAAQDIAIVADIVELRAEPRVLRDLVRRLIDRRVAYSARAALLTRGDGCIQLVQYLLEAD